MVDGFTNMRDLVRAFADAMNLISPEVEDHHEKVTYFSWHLAAACGLTEKEQCLCYYGALLHDVGSVMAEGDISILKLEATPSELVKASTSILQMFPFTMPLTQTVQASQTPWQRIRRLPDVAKMPKRIGQIIHLSDAVSQLLNGETSALNQVEHIRDCIHQVGETEFSPEVLAAFDEVSRRDAVWMDMMYRPQLFLDFLPDNRSLSLDRTIQFTELMSRIIDFRSPFTAMHSAGVAATAESLAQLVGMSDDECKMMRIAGNLHDVGKLKTPKAILEKPGKLTDSEFNIMKEHAYYTYILLKDIEGFEHVTMWAALHHEKLNGEGYPFRMEGSKIPLGSRIMAVADVFSAITEERPYRKGMNKEQTISVLRSDAERGALSSWLVELLIENFDSINERRGKASREASRTYQESLSLM